MALERAQRIGRFWNWLPDFRAIAEREHLTDAAAALRISPSSLSRTLGLLEDELGQALFDRVGRSLALNPRGERLLQAVRGAMRLMDEALLSIEDRALEGPLHIAATGPWDELFVMPALAALRKEAPGIVPVLRSFPAGRIEQALTEGELDVVVHHEGVRNKGLALQCIARLDMRLYGTRHRGKSAQGFVGVHSLRDPLVPAHTESTRVVDGWPLELPREVVARAEDFRSALSLVKTLASGSEDAGGYCAVLPKVMVGEPAKSGVQELKLRGANLAGDRNRQTELPRLPVYSLYRKRLPGVVDRVDAFLGCLDYARS